MGSSEIKQVFVRSYRKGDEDAMVHIFRETSDINLRNAGDAALHPASFIWCRPYLALEAESCFVIDDGNGRAVGYIIGTPNTKKFVVSWREQFLNHLIEQGIQKPGPAEDIGWETNLPNALRFLAHSPEQLLHANHPGLLNDFPSHLHIDILPDYQGSGMGRILMSTYLAHVRDRDARGVHLGMVASNEGAEKFYKRMGFKRFPEVMDKGASGETGRDGTSVYMVISL